MDKKPDDHKYKFKPLTKVQLHAYAKTLQRSKPGLSWADALRTANEDEARRIEAYSNIDENLKRKWNQGQ